MKAVQITHWTDPGQLVVSDIPPPLPAPDQVLIRVHAAAISYSLSLLIAGRYQRKPQLPFVPGNTVAGTVEAIGAEVTRWKSGDRVVASLEFGGLAEMATAHEDNVYPIPAAMPFAEATTLNTSYNSVAAALTWPHLLAVEPGQSLLVTGAGGNIGIAAIQLGRMLGATVIAAASSDAKRERARFEGAHHTVDCKADSLRDAVLAIGSGEGVQRALDPIGGAIFDQVLRCLRPQGRVLPMGFASGEIPRIAANLLLVKNLTVCGLYMGYYKIDARAEHAQRMLALFEQLGRWWESGSIRPAISARHALDEVRPAFARVLQRENIGHVVIELEQG